MTLNLGCGAWLAPGEIGLDLDRAALSSVVLSSVVGHRVCGAAEALPFRDGCFDEVVSNVAFPYFAIPEALRECARVLKPGGKLLVSLHGWRFWLSEYSMYLRQGQWKSLLYQLYVLANGLYFSATGRVLRIWSWKVESIQSVRGMRIAAQRAGLVVTGYVVKGRRMWLWMSKSSMSFIHGAS